MRWLAASIKIATQPPVFLQLPTVDGNVVISAQGKGIGVLQVGYNIFFD
jgi:hypothetical protein